MAILNGLSETTAQTLQLDAGVILTGFKSESEINNFDWNNISTKGLLGATKGGASFSAIPEIRSLLDGVNGARGVYKTGQVIDSWEVTLKTTITEITSENIKLALGAGTMGSETNFKKHSAQVGIIKGAEYSPCIAWIGRVVGKEKPIVILLKNVLNTGGVNFTAEDKGTGSVEVEFKAHFDLAKPNEVPFYIFTPNS